LIQACFLTVFITVETKPIHEAKASCGLS